MEQSALFLRLVLQSCLIYLSCIIVTVLSICVVRTAAGSRSETDNSQSRCEQWLPFSLSLSQLDGNTDDKTGTKVCWRYLNKIQCHYICCCVCGCYCCCRENSLSWKIQNPAICLLRASIFSTANQPLGRTLFQTGSQPLCSG